MQNRNLGVHAGIQAASLFGKLAVLSLLHIKLSHTGYRHKITLRYPYDFRKFCRIYQHLCHILFSSKKTAIISVITPASFLYQTLA
jgi:hypothetical protein